MDSLSADLDDGTYIIISEAKNQITGVRIPVFYCNYIIKKPIFDLISDFKYYEVKQFGIPSSF